MKIRIGIDTGENAIIQSGWDIHPNITNVEKTGNNNNISKKEWVLKFGVMLTPILEGLYIIFIQISELLH